jgi:hypothetical protein
LEPRDLRQYAQIIAPAILMSLNNIFSYCYNKNRAYFSIVIIVEAFMAVKRNCEGHFILKDSLLNKSTAFSLDERKMFGLNGLLPYAVESADTQLLRIFRQMEHLTRDIDKYMYLSWLQDVNETLFYRVLMSDPSTYLKIVYDPTVGEACLKFGHIFRNPRGLYISL